MNSNAITQHQMSHRNLGQAGLVMENENMKSEKQNHHPLTLTGKKAGLKALSAVAGLIALLGIFITPHAAVAQIQIECYPLDALTAGDEYFDGDSLDLANATINITPAFRNGVQTSPADPNVQRALVTPSMVAGGNPPELRAVLVNIRVVPDEPTQYVRLRYGRSGGSGVFGNFGVNGQLVEIDDGNMASLNNRILGNPTLGRVLVKVYPTDDQKGVMELFPQSGLIHRFALGGNGVYEDDVCFALN